jgi:hypothetical protein
VAERWAGSDIADVQIVALSHSTGTDGPLDAIVVDGHVAVIQIDLERVPLAHGVEAGFAGGSLGTHGGDGRIDAPAQQCHDPPGVFLAQHKE